ncbi:uncharacterized protein DS421_12g363050 [Arachis hypogaea]|nr:uncharacterized protein DS421_12g363050 [Arachis hypogaea]
MMSSFVNKRPASLTVKCEYWKEFIDNYAEPLKTPIKTPEETLFDSFHITFCCTFQSLNPTKITEYETYLPDDEYCFTSCNPITGIRTLLVPLNWMHSYLDHSDKSKLLETFYETAVPRIVLDRLLPDLCQFARGIVDKSEFDWDNYTVWRIRVNLTVTIDILDDQDSDYWSQQQSQDADACIAYESIF